METRDKIESLGKGNRWEFDKKKLFMETDYLSEVCGDLHEVATVFSPSRPFQPFFTPVFFIGYDPI